MSKKRNKLVGAIVCAGLASGIFVATITVIMGRDREGANRIIEEAASKTEQPTLSQNTANLVYTDLSEIYGGLTNGFYASADYTALKQELDESIIQLAATEKSSAENATLTKKINALWGQISVLAGILNSDTPCVETGCIDETGATQTVQAAYNPLQNPAIEEQKLSIAAGRISLQSELLRLRKAFFLYT